MKVLLVYPPKAKTLGWLWVPLGLAYIAAVLEQVGHSVRVVDLRCEPRKRYLQLLDEWQPDWTGFSAETVTFAKSKALFPLAKNKGSRVVVGGPHTSVYPHDVISDHNVDVVVMGEGEATIKELVAGIPLPDIRGILYKDGEEIRRTPPRPPLSDIDSLPLPARHLLPIKQYLETSYTLFPLPAPSLHLIASRGCPFDCTFCQPTVRNMFGKTTRYRTPANVVREIKVMVDRYRIRAFHFEDDLLVINKKWLTEFCTYLVHSGLSKMKWTCQSRADTMDEDRARILAEAGCVGVWFGFESGSPKILHYYNKKISPDDSIAAAKVCKSNGLIVGANLMVGAPDETLNDLEMTYKMFKAIDPELSWVSLTSPYPGTQLWRNCMERGLMLAKSYADYDRVITTPKIKTIVPPESIEEFRNKLERRVPSIRRFVSVPHLRRIAFQWLCSVIRTQIFSVRWFQNLGMLTQYVFSKRK